MGLDKDEAKFLGSLMRMKREIDRLETLKFERDWEIMVARKTYNDRAKEYESKDFEKYEKEKVLKCSCGDLVYCDNCIQQEEIANMRPTKDD